METVVISPEDLGDDSLVATVSADDLGKEIRPAKRQQPKHVTVSAADLGDDVFAEAPKPRVRYFSTPSKGTQQDVMGIASPKDRQVAETAQVFVKNDIPAVAKTFGAKIGGGMEQSIGGAMRHSGEDGTDVYPSIDFTRKGMEDIAARDAQYKQDLVQRGTELGNEGRAVIQAAQEDQPVQTRAGRILDQTAQSIGSNLPGMAATMVTGSPAVGLSMMGLQSFGQTYDESRAKGLNIADATMNAAIQGGTEVATEMLPFVALSKYLKTNHLSKEVLKHYLSDIPGEHLATAIQNASDAAYNTADMTPQQRVDAAADYLDSNKHKEDQIDTFFTTILQGAVMGGVAKVARAGNALAPEAQPAAQPAPSGPLSRAVGMAATRAVAPVQSIGSLVAERRGLVQQPAQVAQPAAEQPAPEVAPAEPVISRAAAPVQGIGGLVAEHRKLAENQGNPDAQIYPVAGLSEPVDTSVSPESAPQEQTPPPGMSRHEYNAWRIQELQRLNPQLRNKLAYEVMPEGEQDSVEFTGNLQGGKRGTAVRVKDSAPAGTGTHETRHMIDTLLGGNQVTAFVGDIRKSGALSALKKYLTGFMQKTGNVSNGRLVNDEEIAQVVLDAYYRDKEGLSSTAPDMVEFLDQMGADKYAHLNRTHEEYQGQGGAVARFTTSKGSTYVVGPDGRTTRDKSPHEGHDPSDVGRKDTSDHTVYVDGDTAKEIGVHGGLSAQKGVVLKNGVVQAVYYNERQGKWVKLAEGKVYSRLSQGLHPLELWNGKTDGDATLYSKWHPGNAITNIISAPSPIGVSNETADEGRQDDRQYAQGTESNADGEGQGRDEAALQTVQRDGVTAGGETGVAAAPLDEPKIEAPSPVGEEAKYSFVPAQGDEEGAFSDLTDKKAKVEIDDSGATLNPWFDEAETVGDALDHPELFGDFPSLKDIPLKVIISETLPAGGSFGKNLNKDGSDFDDTPTLQVVASDASSARKIILHEMQHAIQHEYGFARGSSPNTANDQTRRTKAQRMLAQANQLFVKGETESAIKLQNEAYRLRDSSQGYDAYERYAGEEESRRVDARADMPASERRGDPYGRSDIADPKDLIVDMKGDNRVDNTAKENAPADLTLERVQSSFPSLSVTEDNGTFTVTTPSGIPIRISKVGEIEFGPEQRAAAEKEYGRPLRPDERPAAEYKPLDHGAIINLTERGVSELSHESFHAAMNLALTERQKAAVLRTFGNEEKAAAEYQRLKESGALATRKGNYWLAKIYRFLRALRQLISPTAKGVMEDVASGKVWGKAHAGDGGARYAALDLTLLSVPKGIINGIKNAIDQKGYVSMLAASESITDTEYNSIPDLVWRNLPGLQESLAKESQRVNDKLKSLAPNSAMAKGLEANRERHAKAIRKIALVHYIVDKVYHEGTKYSLRNRADQIMTPEQKAAVEAAFGTPPTMMDRAKAFKKDLGKNLVQGVLDQYAPIKDIDMGAYMKARMTKGSDSTLEAVMLYGKPYIDSTGSIRVEFDSKNEAMNGFATILAELDGEHDRFLKWVAGIRAARLKDIGLENLMGKDTIKALKSLNRDGTAENKLPNGEDRAHTYMRVLNHMNAYNDAILKVAVERGLINDATRQMYKDMPYIPFYRLQDEGIVSGFTVTSGLVNQTAWKKLKGGTNKLNDDMLANMLKNWSHLITASARNEAAAKTLTKALELGAAHEVPAGYPGKGIVSFRENTTTVLKKDQSGEYKRVQGEPLTTGTKYKEGGVDKVSDGTMVPEFNVERHFIVTDPHLLDAITSIGQVTKVPKPLRAFKNILAHSVTINPTFKIRNLIRDSISSIALADLSYNPAKNIAKGYKLTAKGSETRAQMLASGGIMRFGSMLDGANADNARKLIDAGVPTDHILDSPNKVAAVWKKYVVGAFDAYQEFGDRGEQVNRAALYQSLLDKGYTPDEAAFWARDLMDFSMSGKWAAVRFLSQTVPFMNARLQGMYKLGRSAKADKKRFGYVIGGVALASLALLGAYHDDDDWQKREAWDRDNYWWFKIGDKAFRIPKPFEIGAIGSVAEWSAELMFNREMTGKKFAARMRDIISSQLSMNPTPQIVKPLIDLWANKDSFTQRPIEGMGMDRLKPEDRFNDKTSGVAKLLGQLGMPNPAQVIMGRYEGLSPVQIDFMIRGYFSWLGVMATTTLDYGIFKPLSGTTAPAMQLKDTFMVGNFVESLPSNSSRYVSEMYDNAKEIEQSYNSYRNAIKSGDRQRAAEIMAKDRENIQKHGQVERLKETVAGLNRQIKRITASSHYSADQKRTMIDKLKQRQGQIAKTTMFRQISATEQ